MLLIVLAWLYVVLMVAVVGATDRDGSVLGGLMTFLFYGLLPVALLGYLFLSPARRRARRLLEAEAAQPPSDDACAGDPDRGGHPSGVPVAPVREEP